jgi:hypothetical protein
MRYCLQLVDPARGLSPSDAVRSLAVDAERDVGALGLSCDELDRVTPTLSEARAFTTAGSSVVTSTMGTCKDTLGGRSSLAQEFRTITLYWQQASRLRVPSLAQIVATAVDGPGG